MSNFTEKHAELWKFIKFSLVGASSTIIEMGVFYLLQYVVFKSILHAPLPDNAALELLGLTQGKGYLYSYIISTTVGYVIAFILNRKTTFKADSNVVLSTILYAMMVVFTIFATAWLGTQFQLLMANHGMQTVGDLIGKPLAAGIATVWTYPLNRFVIHRHKKPAEETQS